MPRERVPKSVVNNLSRQLALISRRFASKTFCFVLLFLFSVIPTGMADFLFRSRRANVGHAAMGPWQHIKSYLTRRGHRFFSIYPPILLFLFRKPGLQLRDFRFPLCLPERSSPTCSPAYWNDFAPKK
jgi:hypothetical protein